MTPNRKECPRPVRYASDDRQASNRTGKSMCKRVENDVDAVVSGRHCVPAYLTTDVELHVVSEKLRIAARAPSGSNTQPWKVYVLTDCAKENLTKAIGEAYDELDPAAPGKPEYDYCPSNREPRYLDRRRKTGWQSYELLGIDKTVRIGCENSMPEIFLFSGRQSDSSLRSMCRWHAGAGLSTGCFCKTS